MLFQKWINNPNDYKTTKMVYDSLTDNIPEELKDIKDYIVSRNIWCVGGDGWAYDIGFSGIDQILASRENINILVLDTQIYSNTGGQASKSTPKSAVASFASTGKKDNRKDLARIAMAYHNAYVAQVSLGANPNQLVKALEEANNYDGPSIVICYAPCISHGIKSGMESSIDQEKLATDSGYFPIFRYHPINGFKLDSKANYDLLDDFFLSQTRFAMLNAVNPDNAKRLREELKDNVKITYDYYVNLSEKNAKDN
jgi:pyruvate-ferredoxin/flavodoxin oxidoreductase